MTDQEAFLRTICEYPHDLRPRLVFADWLDENATETNGFAATAEFIRLQCEIESKPDADAEGREGVLFRANAARWWPGLPNVTVNPDWFADPNGMRTDEPSFLVRNGFVEEIRCPLAWWLGGEECECVSRWELHRVPPGEVIDGHGCYACHGTGRTPANGPTVVSRHPVTRVVVTDREPHQTPNGSWMWFGTTIPHPPAELPLWLFEVAALLDVFPTREAAVETLSRVLVNWARREAGLTPLPAMDKAGPMAPVRDAQLEVDRLNREMPEGTPVVFYPGPREHGGRDCTIRGSFFLTGLNGEIAGWVTGQAGYVRASHIEKR